MQSEINKAAVIRFNKEVIEKGNIQSFSELMDPEFKNRTAMPGANDGPEGMLHTFNEVLRPAFPDMVVEIYDQVAEDDRVCTRKTIHATHTGSFMGIPATGKKIKVDVIDIVRLRDGRYLEHWGINTLSTVIAQLKST